MSRARWVLAGLLLTLLLGSAYAFRWARFDAPFSEVSEGQVPVEPLELEEPDAGVDAP